MLFSKQVVVLASLLIGTLASAAAIPMPMANEIAKMKLRDVKMISAYQKRQDIVQISDSAPVKAPEGVVQSYPRQVGDVVTIGDSTPVKAPTGVVENYPRQAGDVVTIGDSWRLQASLQLCHKGIFVAQCDRGSFFLPFSGIWNVLAYSRSDLSSRKRKVHRRAPRCEMAAGAHVSQFSNADQNEHTASTSGPTLGQQFRAFCFYVTTYIVALPLFFVMLFVQPFVLIFDKHKRKAQHFINKIWASLSILLFYKAEIEGLENLPGPDEAAVYVSNHQSFLDIYTLFLLERPFKFISKTSNFLIPIIGWSMYLTGHVPLRRMDTKSQMECLRHCQKLIKQGVPVFFFPEGTRSRDGKMAQFKRGAFTIAAKAQVPVVPISLIGTGKLMPNGLEGTLRPGSVKVIIHPPLHGSNPDELCEQSRNVISKSLLQHGLEVH